MKTLITGASGFIGSEVVKNKTISFRRVTRDSQSSLNVTDDHDTFYVDSIDSSTDWTGAFENVESVLHLAGLAHNKDYKQDDYDEVNFHGTIKLAEEAQRQDVKRFVFVSSIGVNGTATKQEPFNSTMTPLPHNAYAQSKYDAELGLKKIAQDTGMELVIIRPTLVYGLNAPGNFGALNRLVRKVPVLPFGLVDNKRSFISVHNLADLLVACVKHPNAAGCTFLASENGAISIKEFTNAIAAGAGVRIIQLPVPISLMRLAGKFFGKSGIVEQLVGNLEVDSSNLKQVLNWTPPYTMQQTMSTPLENK